jgi:hypothetical protein
MFQQDMADRGKNEFLCNSEKEDKQLRADE